MLPLRGLLVWSFLTLSALLSGQAGAAQCGKAGDGCWALDPCCKGYTCEAGSQVCRAPGKRGDRCHLTRPCGKGLTCEAGTHRCRGPGRLGDSCHLTRPCGKGLTCEAGTHKCRRPGREGERCHLTRPCARGLTCEAGSHKCRRPGKLEESCHATRPCGPGLSCHPGVHKCYHHPRKPGEPCSAGYSCGTRNFECKPVLQRCFPKKMNLDSQTLCAAFKADALSRAARNAKSVMSYGYGSASAAGVTASLEQGTVYGPQGQFGCYISTCAGGVSDVNIANFGAFGIYSKWDDFAGTALVTNQGASFPFVEVGGFTTAQVLSTDGKRLIGSVNAISVGVGIVPVQVGANVCHTVVVDGNAGLARLGRALKDAERKAKNAKGGTSTPRPAPRPTRKPAPRPTRKPPTPTRGGTAVTGRSGSFQAKRWYRLNSRWQGNGKCLDIVNDAKKRTPRLAKCGNYSGQAWKIQSVGGGYFKLTTAWRGPGQCLDVINDGRRNDRVHLAKCGNASGQRWRLTRAGGDYYRMTTQWRGNRLCLDVINDGRRNDRLRLSACGKYSGQFWRIVPR